jgi:hypothetical protein
VVCGGDLQMFCLSDGELPLIRFRGRGGRDRIFSYKVQVPSVREG